jgi:hypothetical protein
MKPSRLIALAATAGIVAAGMAGCSSHKTGPSTTPGASTTPPRTSVPPGVWQTDDLTALTGAPAAALSRISGYVLQPDGTQHVLYTGADGHLDELWRDTTGWHTDDLTAATNAPPGGGYKAYASPDGTQYAIWMAGFHIHELSWDRNGKHTEDLTAATNAPQAVDNFYGFAAHGTMHVLFVARGDSHLHDLWSDSSGWHTQDLTTAIGAPANLYDMGGYVFRGTPHVVYAGFNERHVDDLWLDSGGWHHDDLTAAAGAPNSIGGTITAYGFEAQGTRHVIYVSYLRLTRGGPVPDAIRELWSDGNGWHTDDLTAATGAPLPWEMSGYAFEAQGTQHIVYDDAAANSHLHELWWDPNGWHADDLTTATGAPPSGGDGPVGYAFEAQATQHIVYLGLNDRHVHELWWGPRAPA